MKYAFPWILATLTLIGGCTKKEPTADKKDPPSETTDAVEAEPSRLNTELIKPLPLEVDVNMDKVLLGRSLFFDGALSKDGSVTCATCHMLEHGGAEPRKSSTGVGAQVGPINSPSVLNAAYNIAQFWDGRAKDLQEQAAGPVENPIEMGEQWDNVVKKLAKNTTYVAEFKKLYSDGITKTNVTDAIAEYEKSLITPSRFDAWLRGDDDAISDAEKAGYETFKEVGCTTCHNGVLVGGNLFQKMGLIEDYFALRGGPATEADLGRFNVTKQASDRHFFKVPSLRNVELTAPYFHDGSQDTLEGAIRIMGRVQLGRVLTDEQVNAIATFLKSLTGKLPAHASPPKT